MEGPFSFRLLNRLPCRRVVRDDREANGPGRSRAPTRHRVILGVRALHTKSQPTWFPAPRYLEKNRIFNPASILVDKFHREEIALARVEAFSRTDVPDDGVSAAALRKYTVRTLETWRERNFSNQNGRSGLFVDICCVKLLRATGVACNKLPQTPGFHAINRGSNAGDDIAYNSAR